MAVRLLKTSVISVELTGIDLSDFQDDDGENEGIDDPNAQPSTSTPNPNSETADTETRSGSKTKKKLFITEEHFQKVTQALVMIRRQQHAEVVMQDGSGLAGLRQKDLIVWYIELLNSQSAYSSQQEMIEEVRRLRAIKERLIKRDGHLIAIDGSSSNEEDGSELSPAEKRILAIAPNYIFD